MNDQPKKSIVVMSTGLFPDADTVETALTTDTSCNIQRHNIDIGKMDDAAWDRLLGEIMSADSIITL